MKLFIQVSPAFYKTLLFNAINKKEEILVAYQERPDRPLRDDDFLKGEREFNNIYQTGGKRKICRDLYRLIKKTYYDELIIGGYDTIYCWLAAFVSPRRKNCLIIESTIRETKKDWLRTKVKRFFFKRISKAYVCGKSHADFVRFFSDKCEIVDIGSVGFIRRVPQPQFEVRKIISKFLFVGRLIPVKNLEFLIRHFSMHPELELTIIGDGELAETLKSMASQNVKLLGAVLNTELPKYYQEADVFVLPSLTETYGLVVDEALNNGTPVLVSHMVGCQDNLVAGNNVGLVFESNNDSDFEDKLSQICDVEIYNQLRLNVSKLDFEEREKRMVDAFVGIKNI